jgi:hypothetical protein|tara:strand:- start:55779 stop:56678 length:900 start_codon:yes stop_codon:yes gene_type:complete
MHDQLWWIFAFISSLLTAAIYLMGQYVAMPALQKTFWRGFIPLLCLTPALLFIEWPSAPLFYAATITTAFIASFTDTKNFEAAARFGAGTAIRMKPFIIWLVFALWFMLHSDARQALLNSPQILWGTLACLLIGAISASYMHKCPVSRKALAFYIPIIMLGACIDILNKTAMDASGLLGGIILYAWIQALLITIITAVAHRPDAAGCGTAGIPPSIFARIRQTFKYGVVIGALFLFANLSKNAAMSYTVNPSYVTAIIVTGPVWVSAYYKTIKHTEAVNIWAGYGLIISALGLILMTNH